MAREIRFAVGRGSDLRSSVWILWASNNKNDFYLAARSSARLAKISFHQSGKYRHAVVSNGPRPPIDQWMRPPRSIEGITPVIDIIVPDFPVANAFRDEMPPAHKKLELIEGPPEGGKRIIRIFLADRHFTEADALRIPSITPISIHGQVPLLAREVAWLVSYGSQLEPAERESFDQWIKAKYTLTLGSSPDSTRAYSPGSTTIHMYSWEFPKNSHHPLIVDVQLGSENLVVVEPSH